MNKNKDFEKLLQFSIINIDKPSGPTSFSVTSYIRQKLGLTKTSHMGTLDPKVTGVLPITLGRACRLAGYLIGSKKKYVGILNTHKTQEIEKLQEIINKNFVGKIKQIPPHKSSVKRALREREVYFFKLKEVSENNKEFLFETEVEGGTYIRKICSDLGEMIGGAHMAELRRTGAGIFGEKGLVDLYWFDKMVEEYEKGNENELLGALLPAEEAIKEIMEFVEIDKRCLKALLNGKPLFLKDVVLKKKIKKGEKFAAFCEDEFVGIYERSGEKKIYGRPEFVYA